MKREYINRKLLLFFIISGVLFIFISFYRGNGEFDEAFYQDDLDQIINEIRDEDPYIRIYIGTNINTHRVDGRQFPIVNRIQNYLKESFPDQQFIIIQEGIHSHDRIGRSKMEEILRDGDPLPDIYIDFPHQMEYFLEKNLLGLDILDYAGVYDLDINRFESSLLEQMRAEGNGKIYGLPFTRSLHAIVYNKSQFEVSGLIPIERPTWEDVLYWASELDLDNLFIENIHLLHQHSLNYGTLIDESMETGEIKHTLMTFAANTNMYASTIQPRYGYYFGGDKLTFTNTAVGNLLETEEEWDLLAYPTFPGARGVGPDFVIEMLAISPHSEKIDVAFEVVNALLSDEFQSELSRLGHGSPLINPNILQVFGADVPAYNGKNVGAFFQNRPSNVASYNEKEILSSEVASWYMYQINQEMDPEEAWEQMIKEIKNIFE